MAARTTKPRRYSGTADFYRKKLDKNMTGLGLKKTDWELKYDPWEGARLDFTTPKGLRKTLQRLIDNQSIHYASDCLAQIALAMERFYWLKREGIFDLDTLVAGLPALPPPLPECFRIMGFESVPADVDAVYDRYRTLARERHEDILKDGGKAFIELTRATEDAKKYLEGK